jgi:RNA recognition motif-containing protein
MYVELATKLNAPCWDLFIKAMSRVRGFPLRKFLDLNKDQIGNSESIKRMNDSPLTKPQQRRLLDKNEMVTFANRHFMPLFEQRYMKGDPLFLQMLRQIRSINVALLLETRWKQPEGLFPSYVIASVPLSSGDAPLVTRQNVRNEPVRDSYRNKINVITSDDLWIGNDPAWMEWRPRPAYNMQKDLQSKFGPHKIFLDGLAVDVCSRQLMNVFQECGEVEGVEIFRERLRSLLIDLEDRSVNPERLESGISMIRRYKLNKLLKRLANTEFYGGSYQQGHILSNKEHILKSKSGQSPAYAAVYFKTAEAKARALSSTMRTFGVTMNRVSARTADAAQVTDLYIGNMPLKMSRDELIQFMQDYLEPALKLERDIKAFHGLASVLPLEERVSQARAQVHRGFVILECASHEAATTAWQILQNTKLRGKRITVGFCTARRKQFHKVHDADVTRDGYRIELTDKQIPASTASAFAEDADFFDFEDYNVFDNSPAKDDTPWFSDYNDTMGDTVSMFDDMELDIAEDATGRDRGADLAQDLAESASLDELFGDAGLGGELPDDFFAEDEGALEEEEDFNDTH